MEFGEIPVDRAEGAILAHTVKHAGCVFKKGRVLSAEDVAAIAAAGIGKVFAARLGPDDVPEDERHPPSPRCGGCGTSAKPLHGRAISGACTAAGRYGARQAPTG